MEEQIKLMQKEAMEELNKVQEAKELNEVRVKFLGKKGKLTAILRGMGALTAEERPKIGNLANQVRDEIEKVIKEK